MMRFLIVALFCIASTNHALAGQFVAIQEAEALFLRNSLQVKAARTALQKADADVFDAGAWPNPVARYSREALGNGEKTVEETYSLSQTIDLFGKRSKKTEAARKNREAQGYFIKQEIAELLVEMKRAYYRVLLLQNNIQSILETAGRFTETEVKMRERMQAGDVSEAELMKLISERRRIERGVDALGLELAAEKTKLGLMLGITDFTVAGELKVEPVVPDVQEAVNYAVINSPGLRALSAAADSSEAALAAAKRGRLPSIELEGGYKKSSEGFTGPVIGIVVPLPLFDRNMGETARSRAEAALAKLSLESAKRSVAGEAALLVEKMRSLMSRGADLARQVEESRELSLIAALAYEEGESGLLEWLEAVRSEKDMTIEYHEALYELRSAVYRLEALSGLNLSERGDVP